MRDGVLLMIPGPVEVSPAVAEAAAAPPPSHLAPDFIADFGAALADMRTVWGASGDAQPVVVPGSGTLAMELALTNLLSPGDRAVVVVTGYFGDRMIEMLRRRGVEVTAVRCGAGEIPPLAEVARALEQASPKALFATHVDTSTGVRVDVEALAGLARAHEVLSVFDGVCSVGGERFEMSAWGADVMLTASQKALGVPPGLALLVVGPRALQARETLAVPPPLSIDVEAWGPIFQAYEAGTGRYFSTPATSLVRALRASLREIVTEGVERRIGRHQQVAEGFRAAWREMGLALLPANGAFAADTLSAVRFPEGIGPELVGAIRDQGVVVAGGLYPGLERTYFRVGHMGPVVGWPEALERTVRAVGNGLLALGHTVDVDGAVAAAEPHFRA